MKTNANCLLIPKEWTYPEDLEDGIFLSNESIVWSFDPASMSVIIYATSYTTECDIDYTSCHSYTKKKKYKLEDYYFFYNGKLMNEKLEDHVYEQ